MLIPGRIRGLLSSIKIHFLPLIYSEHPGRFVSVLSSPLASPSATFPPRQPREVNEINAGEARGRPYDRI